MNEANDLVGSWESDVEDPATISAVGKVRMEFFPDGVLAYIIFTNETMQVMKLTYRVVGNTLVTDQPSHPRIEQTTFDLSDQSLKLLHNTTWISFRKVT